MNFAFEIIAHRDQRYPTAGDYIWRKGAWIFRVSRMKDRRYCWLVFLHELIEWAIATRQGVRQGAIDRFDIAYENARSLGMKKAACGCEIQDEPGDDPHCPVFKAHQVATKCERLIAEALGVDWEKYNEAVESL